MPRRRRQINSRGERLLEAPADKAIINPANDPASDRATLDPSTNRRARTTRATWRVAAVCIVLVVATVFSFRAVKSNDFLTLDDNDYVLQNRQVQQGLTLHSIAWAFTTFHASNWHPLTWISHIVDWTLYGRNPYGHHMTNVYWHAANAVLLFLLLLYMTGFLWRAAIVAFLFALHPAHVESVAWIAERKDVLCAFFWFATLFVYAWYVRRPSWKRFAWVVFGFACALLSKPMAVTLPFTLLLLDYWPLRRITFALETQQQFSSLRKLGLEKWPLFIMAAISSVLTFFAQKAGGAVAALQVLPLWERICNAAISYCRYILIMFWPDPLRAFYYLDTNNIGVKLAVLSVIVLCLVTAVCWHFQKKQPYCLIGWLWFLGTLVPVIGIVQVGDQALAERYTYVPFIGLFTAIVWLIGDAVIHSPKMIRVATALLAVAVIVACAIKTEAQVKVWKDTVTLFTHVLNIDPRGELPNSSLGVAYVRQGRIADAEEYLERALQYNPSGALTLSYSAFCLMRTMMQTHDQRNLPLAGQRLEQALRVAPGDPDVLSNMALWSSLMGRRKDEEAYSRKVIAGRPDFITARLYLADALQAQARVDEAEQEYRQVLAIEPDNWVAHNNLGIIFGSQGLTEEALKEFQLSLAINPDQAMPHAKAGRILAEKHRYPEAVDEFSQALRFDPANSTAHNDLGVALFLLGDYEKAAEQFSDAVRIDPAYADARRNLDLAQARGKSEKSVTSRASR